LKEIQIIGACTCCKETAELLQKKVTELNIDANIVWLNDLKYIVDYQILYTPAIIIDGTIVYENSKIPTDKEIIKMLQQTNS